MDFIKEGKAICCFGKSNVIIVLEEEKIEIENNFLFFSKAVRDFSTNKYLFKTSVFK